MPKISLPDFVEGDVVEKSDITDLRDNINTNLIGKIDSDNIREEGLDRRVFASGAIVPKYTSTQRVYSSTRQSVETSNAWELVRYDNPDDLKGNKRVYNAPVLGINWDTETDTHCVIRLSMYVDSRTTEKRPKAGENFWDFGLLIVPPGLEPDPTPLTGFVPAFGSRVSPYQRVGLNNAFTIDADEGYFTFAQSDYLNGSVDWNPGASGNERQPVGVVGYPWGFHVDTYPRGAWYQYPFDRYSNFNSSISMTAHATSEFSRLSSLNLSQFMWKDSGLAKIYVVYRSNLTGISPNYIDIHNLNLSAQIYRR